MSRSLLGVIGWNPHVPHALSCEAEDCSAHATHYDLYRDSMLCGAHDRGEDVSELEPGHVRARLREELGERHDGARRYRRYRLREMTAWLRDAAEAAAARRTA